MRSGLRDAIDRHQTGAIDRMCHVLPPDRVAPKAHAGRRLARQQPQVEHGTTTPVIKEAKR